MKKLFPIFLALLSLSAFSQTKPVPTLEVLKQSFDKALPAQISDIMPASSVNSMESPMFCSMVFANGNLAGKDYNVTVISFSNPTGMFVSLPIPGWFEKISNDEIASVFTSRNDRRVETGKFKYINFQTSHDQNGDLKTTTHYEFHPNNFDFEDQLGKSEDYEITYRKLNNSIYFKQETGAWQDTTVMGDYNQRRVSVTAYGYCFPKS